MTQIKIVHLLLNLECGGMESGVVNLVNHINQDKFSCWICCLEASGKLEERLSSAQDKIIELHKKPGKSFKVIAELRKLYANYQFDIVHTHNYATLIYGGLACLFSKKPYLVHGEHGDLPLQLNNPKYLMIRRLLSRRVFMFHAVSESMLKLCREKVGISEDKIRHIANGLDLDKFSPEDSSLARHKHGFKETDFIILGIGSFYPWKNFSLLLTAAKLLKDKNIDFRLVLVGDGPLFDGLKSKAILESLEQHVYFFGYRKDIPDIINMSDCLIQPSLTEGMSNTIMEALACAKPVIASDIAGNKELVRNGINGYLFSSNNVTDLVEKIILIYKDKGSRNRMAEAARKIAEEKFSLKQMVSEYEKLYLEVIDHGSIGH